VAGANAAAAVAVEVLVEWHEVAPLWIGLKRLYLAEHGTPAIRVLEENRLQSA
jgi:hypothetical protein